MNKKDESPVVFQRDKINFELNIREFKWTEKQRLVIDKSLEKTSRMTMIDGLWGTSKTFLAVYCALRLLKDKKIGEIIYVRNPVQSSSFGNLGFLKGSLATKMETFIEPLYQKLKEFLPEASVNRLIKEDRVKSLPVALSRGHSYNCVALIIDEASCLTKEDLLLVLSRVGQFSKVFCVGDNFQSDIGTKNGFPWLINLLNDEESRQNGINYFEFKEESDVVRSGFLRFLMKKVQASSKMFQ